MARTKAGAKSEAKIGAKAEAIKGGAGGKDQDAARRNAIELAVSSIEKQFGKGSIQTMNQEGSYNDVPSFSSGGPSIDIALGIGGYPRGRVIEIYGPESSGKTTLTLHAIAEIQKSGGVAAFIDASTRWMSTTHAAWV